LNHSTAWGNMIGPYEQSAPMEIHQIRYFLAVCAELNFTNAARRCGIAQATLSLSIKRMERAIGGSLFLRKPKIQLTPPSEQLRPILAEIDGLLAQAESLYVGVTKTEPDRRGIISIPL
jgi:DNA-binding transcriptional LysR family regulator